MRPVEARAVVRDAIESYFRQSGMRPVETAAIQASHGFDANISAFQVHSARAYGRPMALHTSPEYAMKRIIQSTGLSCFQFAQVFRDEPESQIHMPVFEMLEWYRVGRGSAVLIEDCLQILRQTARSLRGSTHLHWNGQLCDVGAEPAVLTCEQAISACTGIEITRYAGDKVAFGQAAQELAGITVGADDAWDDIFFKILLNRVEPWLGLGSPTFLTNYPLAQASLARADPDRPGTAERVELYVCGVELANGFGELTDIPTTNARGETERRGAAFNQGGPLAGHNSIEAITAKGLPRMAGMALGFDRLVMLLTGANRVQDVSWNHLP